MLQFRLTELDDIVDYFVIVESNKTHTGKEKPLYFSENKSMFEKWLKKIVLIVVDDMPERANSWDLIFHQRNCITRGIEKLNPDKCDLIMVSDVDEIPDINTLSKMKHIISKSQNVVYQFEQDLYYYDLDHRFKNKWYKLKILSYQTFTEQTSVQEIRTKHDDTVRTVRQGGWHLSYFGDIDFIKTKLQNAAHTEFNNDQYVNDQKIQKDILSNRSIIDGSSLTSRNTEYLPKHYQLLETLLAQKNTQKQE